VTHELLDLLNLFDPIGLEETNAQAALLRRVDTKYVLRPDQLQALLPAWVDDYRVLEIEGARSSHYHSVYYDTPGLALYRAHHAGASSRVKFRLREYTESNLSYYEVKIRSNKGITDKQRSRMRETQSLEEHLEHSVQQHPRHLQGELVQETLQIDYDRITLVAKTGSERVTIDRNLHFSAEGRSVLLDDRIIVEVKQERGKRTSLDRQMRSIGIKPGSISKYCLGILQLYPEAKRNRFKLPMRILDKQLRTNGIDASGGRGH
jgi:hypothetical protein